MSALHKPESKPLLTLSKSWGNEILLVILGGAGFWTANFAISLTPIAADYRTALSIPYLPMLLEALLGGLLIACLVSFVLLRFFEKIPGKRPLLKSLFLSAAGLVLLTLLVEVPAKFLHPIQGAFRWFLIGAVFNTLRILALGLVIGLLFEKIQRGAQA